MILKKLYSDADVKQELVQAFIELFSHLEDAPIFICIGSDRHILDCFGPLVGTMIKEVAPHLEVYGTLEGPIHARNLVTKIALIKRQHPGRLEIAIDASVGMEADIGAIKLRRGSLVPGKALAKRLPAIGHLSLVGIVGSRLDHRSMRAINAGSLSHVYAMARVVCDAVYEWDCLGKNNNQLL